MAKINFDLEAFSQWLQNHGCEILPPTNEFEIIRFKGKETGIIYNTGKYSGQYASRALVCFMRKIRWTGGPEKTVRKGSYYKEKLKLLERDGKNCFYCGKPLKNDVTLEHLIPLVKGGKNDFSNMVLAHESCNNSAGTKPLNEKVIIAVKNRAVLLHNLSKEELTQRGYVKVKDLADFTLEALVFASDIYNSGKSGINWREACEAASEKYNIGLSILLTT